HFIQCACHFTESCTSSDEDGNSVSKRLEIKHLIEDLKKVNPFVEGNIFKSVENVNLKTIIAYKENGVKHSFLEGYNEKD
ncbi:MAG: ATPase, partial [Lachnospiraceae bacterium]|nr:ATPase [Lachnospiraceae bacterium]